MKKVSKIWGTIIKKGPTREGQTLIYLRVLELVIPNNTVCQVS